MYGQDESCLGDLLFIYDFSCGDWLPASRYIYICVCVGEQLCAQLYQCVYVCVCVGEELCAQLYQYSTHVLIRFILILIIFFEFVLFIHLTHLNSTQINAPPRPRMSHSAFVRPDENLYIVGGFAGIVYGDIKVRNARANVLVILLNILLI